MSVGATENLKIGIDGFHENNVILKKDGHLEVRGPTSILVPCVDRGGPRDKDNDWLNDVLEGQLATAFRPLIRFDSDEAAREIGEPIVVFQVRPVKYSKLKLRLAITWLLLFNRDGGYGPDSLCKDSHPGDNEKVVFEVESEDDGVSWRLSRVDVGAEIWPEDDTIEAFNDIHPVIYMSAHKHHKYLGTDNNHRDSRYSKWGCNDDVNGGGYELLVITDSLEAKSGYFNNVGEPEQHPHEFFVNALEPVFRGQTVWGERQFYSVPANSRKFLRKRLPARCDRSPPNPIEDTECLNCKSLTCCGPVTSSGCCLGKCFRDKRYCDK